MLMKAARECLPSCTPEILREFQIRFPPFSGYWNNPGCGATPDLSLHSHEPIESCQFYKV